MSDMTNKEVKKTFPTRLSMIVYFLQGSKKYFALSILFACLVSLLDLINPKIISFSVDAVINNETVELPSVLSLLLGQIGGVAYLKGHLYWLAILVVVVAILGAACRIFFPYV